MGIRHVRWTQFFNSKVVLGIPVALSVALKLLYHPFFHSLLRLSNIPLPLLIFPYWLPTWHWVDGRIDDTSGWRKFLGSPLVRPVRCRVRETTATGKVISSWILARFSLLL